MLGLLLFILHVVDVALPVVMAVLYFMRMFEFKHPVWGYCLFCVGGIFCIASLDTTALPWLFGWERDLRLLIFLVVFLLAAHYFLHGSFSKKLYHTLQFTFSYIICEYGFALTVERVKSRYEVTTIPDALISLFQYLIFSVLVLCLFMIQLRFFLERSKDMTDRQYALMAPMPLILLVLIMMSIRMNDYVYNMTLFLFSVVMNLWILGLYRSLKRTSERIATGRLMLKETRFYQEQLKGQKELHRLRHDMKNMLLGIRADLDLQAYDQARAKIDGIVDDISATNLSITGIVFLDAVLAPKVMRMKEAGIALRHQVDLREEDVLSRHSVDLSVILGNLLDNAYEGTLRLPDEEKSRRFVELSLKQTEDVMTILIANSAPDVHLSKEKAQPSAKEAGRVGIGMESIRERCALLHGYSHFRYENGVFEAMVQIPLR
ncbi:MAG: GHKL domain-containing protein [Lachnospiraceae bacterium]|nr:GHKL domain-containing protein [Lachnospiraceae bacterium]